MARRLVFLYSSAVKPWNADIEKILEHLSALRTRGITCELLDVAGMEEEELTRWKEEGLKASVRHGIGTRRPFGSKGKGGFPYFGREEPALLVYAEGEGIAEVVFPHLEKGRHERRQISIEEFLEQLLEGDER